jgi:hypothetical protein
MTIDVPEPKTRHTRLRAPGPARERMKRFRDPVAHRPRLTRADLNYVSALGKTGTQVRKELLLLVQGVSPIRLRRPCRVGDGIRRLTRAEAERLARIFESHVSAGTAMRFVAASGAASRMFRAPISCRRAGRLSRAQLRADAERGSADARELLRFLDNLRRFPFFDELCAAVRRRGGSVEQLRRRGAYAAILGSLLDADGLGYGTAPKGLIPFHAYGDGARTAFDAGRWLRDRNGTVRIHFTVRPEDEEGVRMHLANSAQRFENARTKFDMSISVQERSSDTMVLDGCNQPVRGAEQPVLLWPSGHGALLKNLGALKADIVFIRTIDNVLPDRLKATVSFFNKVLGGLLVSLQAEIFRALEVLEGGARDDQTLTDIERWAGSELGLQWPAGFHRASAASRARGLHRRLHRPLRVCAMVPHRGDPGGGPFWAMDPEGNESLQIVEASQVDMKSDHQRAIWEASAFFNPADLACGLRDHRGRPYDLEVFHDPASWFITGKTHEERAIKVLERPGLWNGAMALWNTVFLEAPRATVCPVKSVLDLLRPEHRS